MFATSDIQALLEGVSLDAGKQSGASQSQEELVKKWTQVMGMGMEMGETDSRNTKRTEPVGVGCWR